MQELPPLPHLELQSIWDELKPKNPRFLQIATEMVSQNLSHIESVKSKHNWDDLTIAFQEQRYYVLGKISDQNAIKEYLRQISSQATKVMTRHFGSCYEAAEGLIKIDPNDSSFLHNASWKMIEKPIHIRGLGNHTVFQKHLGEQWLVVDLTARFYIDIIGNKMEILVLVADSEEEVKNMLSEVYGDNWYSDIGGLTRFPTVAVE